MAIDPTPGVPPLDHRSRPPVVKLDRRAGQQWAMTPQPAAPDPARAKARIVAALTFACTALALYDLFLIAAGL